MDFNTVANHPEVRPHLGGSGVLDLGPLIEQSFTFQNEYGGFVVHPLLPCIYEVHSLFLPEGKGTAGPLAIESIRAMFAGTDCARLLTKVPDDNEGAKAIAKRVGFVEEFRRDHVAEWNNGGVSYQTITLERWRDNDPECEQAGEWFHHRLEAEKLKAGSAVEIHPDDPAHHRAVGATVFMFRAGQIEKGVAFYNLWAVFAGYAPIAILESGNLDVGDIVIKLKGNDFEVVECR